MPRNTASETKKKGLLARIEKLEQDIKYYEKRIEEHHSNNTKCNFDGNASLDSDDDFTISLDVGPSLRELKVQDSFLKTCLKATQELTSLSIQHTHCSIIVENPVIDGVQVTSEPGTWREVAAECYIDLVSFSITFYTHQPSRKFAAASFRGLTVLPVKKVQEAELSHHSLLASATCPSDAIDVLRSYAVAYRARRATVQRLAKTFPKNLFMEPIADGGFVIKYANLLEISWHLENNTSTIAPFHHKMKFQIDYIEESYLKIIKQLYKQLANPSLETDERTLLLSNLISTVCEAHPNLDSESDLEPDTQNVNNDHSPKINVQTDGQDNADERVMAPPKTIPKKAKPKGKENSENNCKSVKRSAGHDDENEYRGKKAKVGDDSGKTDDANGNNVGKKDKTDNGVNDVGKTAKRGDNRGKKANANGDGEKALVDDLNNDIGKKSKADNVKNDVGKKSKTNDMRSNVKSVSDIVKSNEDKVQSTNQKTRVMKEKPAVKKAQKHDDNVEHVDKAKTSDEQNYNKATNKVINQKNKEIDDRNEEDSQKQTNNENKAIEKSNKNSEKVINNASSKQTGKKEIKGAQDKVKDVNDVKKDADMVKKPINNKIKLVTSNVTKLVKKSSDTEKNAGDIQKNAKNDKADDVDKNTTEVKENIPKNHDKTGANNMQKNLEHNIVKENVKKNQVNPKNSNAKSNEPAKQTITANIKTIQGKETVIKVNNEAKVKKSDNLKEKTAEKGVQEIADPDIPTDSHTNNKENVTNSKNTKSEPTNKNNDPTKKTQAAPKNHTNLQKNPKYQTKHISIKSHRNSMGKVTKTLPPSRNISKNSGMNKIPQKKLSPAYAAALQQMPVRMSPRMTTMFKSASDSNLRTKIAKPVSNIPRPLKSAPKSK